MDGPQDIGTVVSQVVHGVIMLDGEMKLENAMLVKMFFQINILKIFVMEVHQLLAQAKFHSPLKDVIILGLLLHLFQEEVEFVEDVLL